MKWTKASEQLPICHKSVLIYDTQEDEWYSAILGDDWSPSPDRSSHCFWSDSGTHQIENCYWVYATRPQNKEDLPPEGVPILCHIKTELLDQWHVLKFHNDNGVHYYELDALGPSRVVAPYEVVSWQHLPDYIP